MMGFVSCGICSAVDLLPRNVLISIFSAISVVVSMAPVHTCGQHKIADQKEADAVLQGNEHDVMTFFVGCNRTEHNFFPLNGRLCQTAHCITGFPNSVSQLQKCERHSLAVYIVLTISACRDMPGRRTRTSFKINFVEMLC